MKMEIAKNGVISLTRAWTRESLEKKDGYSFPVMIRMRDRRSPAVEEYATAKLCCSWAGDRP